MSSDKADEKVKTTMLLPKELVKKAKYHAIEHDTTVTQIVTDALKDYLSAKKKEGK